MKKRRLSIPLFLFNIHVFSLILFNYIFRQLATTAFAAVGLFVFVLVTGNALREILGLLAAGRLGIGVFGELLGLLIPYVIAYALPLGVLTAVLIVFGRLSAQREIVAMKAAGMSLYRIGAPVFLLALLGAILCLFVNLDYAPRARALFRERMANVFTEDPLQFIQPGRFIEDFPGYILYADAQEGSALLGFRIWELDDRGQVITVLRAQEGSFHYNTSEDELILTLREGAGEHRNQADLSQLKEAESMPSLLFHEASLKLPLNSFLKRTIVKKKLSLLTISELLEKWKILSAENIKEHPGLHRQQIAILMQIQKGIANAFSVFALALLALPLGIRVSRSETYANLALALLLAMAYYLSMVLMTALEDYPQLRPDLLLWLPNLCLIGLGAYLLKRSNQH